MSPTEKDRPGARAAPDGGERRSVALTHRGACSSIERVIYVLRYLLISIYTIVWGTIGVTIAPLDRSGRASSWVARSWIRWVLWSCRISVRAEGLENLRQAAPCVIMANHQSVFDIAAIVAILPVHWKFVAKRELLWIPFFGWALALGRQVVIDRGQRERALRSLAHAARRMREERFSVVIFPEGTRSREARLGPFKSGGFHMAIEAGVPIVPATVSGSQRITPKHSLRVESGVIGLRFGAPISTRGRESREARRALQDEVRQAIEAGFDPALQGRAPSDTQPRD